jgi:hypothetical protein
MKKKSVFLRSALALLIVALFAGALFAGNTTMARYVATASGTGIANVANFDVKLVLGNDTILIGDWDTNLTVALFDNVVDWGPGDDANVRGSDLIAPGTKGSIPFNVINDSDVTIEVTATATLDDMGSLTGAISPFTFEATVAVVEVEIPIGSDLITELATELDGDTLGFDWQWEIGDGDVRDTEIGILAIADPAIGPTAIISVTASQVD